MHEPSYKPQDLFEWGRWMVGAIMAFAASIPELTIFLIWLMAIDFIFGVGAAIRLKDVSPSEAWWGVTKKMGVLGIIAVASLIDRYVNLPGIDLVTATTIFYIGPELLSIFRNAIVLGIPVPPQLTQVLRIFQKDDPVEASATVKTKVTEEQVEVDATVNLEKSTRPSN